MFYIDNNDLTNFDYIATLIKQFELVYKPQLVNYKNYYLGKQKITSKYYEDQTKPCNRIVTNFCYNIVNNYLGYLVGTPISYKSDTDMQSVQDILNYNDINNTDRELLRNALIYGVGYEIHYIDKYKKQRFVVPDTVECIPIFNNSLENELVGFIRYTKKDNLQDSKGYNVEVYSETEKKLYETTNDFAFVQEKETIINPFTQIPVCVFKLNEDCISIYDPIISLQDAYNTLLSSEVDDFEAFCDAYLALYGVTVDEEELKEMKHNRILVLGQDSKAEYLSKNIRDTQIENMLNNIKSNIENISNSPDFNSENFTTNSGISVRYKLLGFENNASSIESAMKLVLQKRIEIITELINKINQNNVWRDVTITFIRNLPINTVEIAQVVTQLRGLVSDETLLSQIPFVTNVAKELARNKKEQNEGKTIEFDSNATVDNNTIANINNTLSTKNNKQPNLK